MDLNTILLPQILKDRVCTNLKKWMDDVGFALYSQFVRQVFLVTSWRLSCFLRNHEAPQEPQVTVIFKICAYNDKYIYYLLGVKQFSPLLTCDVLSEVGQFLAMCHIIHTVTLSVHSPISTKQTPVCFALWSHKKSYGTMTVLWLQTVCVENMAGFFSCFQITQIDSYTCKKLFFFKKHLNSIYNIAASL